MVKLGLNDNLCKGKDSVRQNYEDFEFKNIFCVLYVCIKFNAIGSMVVFLVAFLAKCRPWKSFFFCFFWVFQIVCWIFVYMFRVRDGKFSFRHSKQNHGFSLCPIFPNSHFPAGEHLLWTQFLQRLHNTVLPFAYYFNTPSTSIDSAFRTYPLKIIIFSIFREFLLIKSGTL